MLKQIDKLPPSWPSPLVVMQRAGLKTPPHGDTTQMPASVSAALTRLDQLALEPFWRDVDRLRRLVDTPVAYALALDIDDPRQRLRLALARAYAEASAIELAYRQRMHDLKLAAEVARRLRRFHNRRLHKTPQGVVVEDPDKDVKLAVEILNRQLVESPEAKRARRIWASGSNKDLQGLVDQLEGLASMRKNEGRHEERGREFLLLRLAEVFSLLSGEEPDFRAARFVRGVEPKTHWHRFLGAALSSLGWQELSWVDGALRKVFWTARYPGRRPDNENEWRSRVGSLRRRAIRNSIALTDELKRLESYQPSRLLEYGHLQSSGMLIDFGLPLDGGRTQYEYFSQGLRSKKVPKSG